jgi:cytochrome c
MKLIVLAAAASVALVGASGVANAQEALAKSAGCLSCHAVDTKKMGPSFKEIAAKYKGQADAAATIETKLASGKGHPAVKTSADDNKALVKWILAM